MDRRSLIGSILAFIMLLVLVTLVFGEWSFLPGASPDPETMTAPPDKLAEVLARGTLIIATDPAYPPQSDLIEGARRAGLTKCESDQYTVSEFRGFDIAVATEITRRLGVEPCFVITEWEEVTAGNWSDRWDISIGSMAITSERMEVVYFTQPYYTTPVAFFVHQDNTTFSHPGDLSGQRIGVCAGCTYESFLDGSLHLPGQAVDFVVKKAIIIDYGTDTMALYDLTVGDGLQLDAVLTAEPNGQGLIGIGQPLKQLGDPVFYEYLAAAVDKNQHIDPLPLVKQVSAIIREMHADGTLRELSQLHFETDLTTRAANFSAAGIGQFE